MKKILFALIVLVSVSCNWRTDREKYIADSIYVSKKAKIVGDTVNLLDKKDGKFNGVVQSDVVNHQTERPDNLPNDYIAEKAAKSLLKKRFNDPDNVVFLPTGSKIAIINDGSFVFVGKLRALNDYGENLLVTYNIGIKFEGGDQADLKNWTVKFCNIR